MIDPPTEIKNNTILLRRYRLSDVPLVIEAVKESIPQLKPWMSWCHDDYTEADARAWLKSLPAAWEKGTSYDFAIFDAQDGGYLGGCGLNHIRWMYRFANLGYWVRTNRTGQGIASDVVPLLARYAFEHLSLNRVEIVVAEDNYASLRVAEKAGALREGILRNRMMVGENVYNSVMHSLIWQDLESGEN